MNSGKYKNNKVKCSKTFVNTADFLIKNCENVKNELYIFLI